MVGREGLSALTLTAASTSGSMVRDVDTSWWKRKKKALPVIALNDDELSGYEENVLIGSQAGRCLVAGVSVRESSKVPVTKVEHHVAAEGVTAAVI